jgi:GNAT superfamily N-acetyltransferase
MNTPNCHIRLMRKADIPFANLLREQAGWNQRPDDWLRFINTEPKGCFIAEADGRRVGTATTTRYGLDVAWIGMVLVHQDHRRHGYGRALLLHCIEHLQRSGIACIKLDATPLGRTLYNQLGFKEEWTLARWETSSVLLRANPMPCRVRPWTTRDKASIVRLDSRAFGTSRWDVLWRIHQQVSRSVVHVSPKRRINGFGQITTGANALHLGPVVAESLTPAGAIIKTLSQAWGNRRVFWDVPDRNLAAVELAKTLGFTLQRPLIRMFLGKNKMPGDVQMQFAIAAPEIG